MSWKIAIVGATGNVGREMLNILAEREFPASEVVPIASRKSVGRDVSYGDKTLKCKAIENYDFRGTDIVLMSAGSVVSGDGLAIARRAPSSIIRRNGMDPDVPLVAPSELNGDHEIAKKNIIANPNCSTAQMVVALKPLHDVARVKRVVVSTYQSVSGAGKDAMDELFNQTRAIFVTDSIEAKKFTKQIAFNVIPHIDSFMDDGYERGMEDGGETRKILDPDIKVTATCVRVPVFVGHSEAINVEFERPITPDQARNILREAPGCMVIDKREDGGYVTPVECVGDYATFISRIRKDPTVENGLALWCVSDNLRKGAALNAIQIAEILISRHLKKAA
jgi:aspartate-semialdehyde dehydrogenase